MLPLNRSKTIAVLAALIMGGALAQSEPTPTAEQTDATPPSLVIDREALLQSAALGLELWLSASRQGALAGAQPVPEFIRDRLKGVVDDALLETVRYRVGNQGVLNIASLSMGVSDAMYSRRVAAVTLIDVIVFRRESDALYNPSLWVHELWHVQQFRDWTLRGFAERYVRNPALVEEPAYRAGAAYLEAHPPQ